MPPSEFPIEESPLSPETPLEPDFVFVQGRNRPGLRFTRLLPTLRERGLGIVGTRQPTPGSRGFLRDAIRDLRGSGLVIISGFAVGIDAEAHLGALETGLATVAVVAGGLDLDYPNENSGLRTRLLESGGLIVSESPPGARPYPKDFLERNRLIAAWSKATWVVEAPARSGALSTAAWAHRMDRDVYAVPGFPDDPHRAGNRRLLEEGAFPFWGVHSLGSTWANLADLRSASRRSPARYAPGFEFASRA